MSIDRSFEHIIFEHHLQNIYRYVSRGNFCFILFLGIQIKSDKHKQILFFLNAYMYVCICVCFITRKSCLYNVQSLDKFIS